MKNKVLCNYCGLIWDDSGVMIHTSECASTIASRQMKALESIAASLEKMANPPIAVDEWPEY